MRRLGVASLFLALTLVFTYPLARRPGTVVLDLGPDTRLFLWTLAWDAHALSSRPLAIFDANIFHPEKRTLAYSEHQIGSALFAAPVLWTTGNPALGMNAVALLSCFLSGLFAFHLGRELGLSRGSAMVVGVVYAFSPPRFYRLGQLHLATVQWIPLCLAFLHRYARGGSRTHLVLATLTFTLQALSGGQSALFLALAALALLAYLWVFGELKPRGSLVRDSAVAMVLAALLNFLFVLPYLEVQRELGLTRSLDEAEFWSPNPESYIASPAHVDRWFSGLLGFRRQDEREAKAYLFPGLLPIVLALAALFSKRTIPAPATGVRPWLRVIDLTILAALAAAVLLEAPGGIHFRWFSASGGLRAFLVALALLAIRIAISRQPVAFAAAIRRFIEPRLGVAGGFYLFLAVFSLWASLGPRAGLYAALYRLVPGFDFIRVPSRFSVLTVLGLAVLAGIGAGKLRKRATVAAAIVLLLVELAAFPLEVRPYSPGVSPMDAALAKMEPAPTAMFPIPDPRDEVEAGRRHSLYMLHSTAHFFPMVNGYSGFTPAFHDRLFRELVRFPTEKGLSELEALAVRYAVFHRDGYADAEWAEVLSRIGEFSGRLELRAAFEEGSIYEIVSRDPRGRESSEASRSRSSSGLRGSGP